MAKAIRFRTSEIPRQPGETGRLKIANGPDRGNVYVLNGSSFTMGRDPNCDVVVNDQKVSRSHVALSLVNGPRGSGVWVVKDLGSANGLIYRGKKVSETKIGFQDLFQVGDTFFELVSSEAQTQILRAPSRSVKSVEQEHVEFEKQRAKVRALSATPVVEKNKTPTPAKEESSEARNKRILIIGVGVLLVGGVFYLDQASQVSKQKSKSSNAQKESSPINPVPNSPDTERQIASFLQEGLRELRNKNYLRSRAHFENILQVRPDHYLAKVYLSLCQSQIDEEIKAHLQDGKKNIELGKIKEARAEFILVTHLLARSQDATEFKEASQQIENIDRLLGKTKTGGEP